MPPHAAGADPTQIRANIVDDGIGVLQWPPNATVTVEVWDGKAKTTKLFSTTVTVDGNGNSTVTGFDIEPGHYLVATDGVTTKELELVAIGGTIDPVADTVTGTAPANTNIDVDTEGCRTTVSDGAGAWSVDFAGPGMPPCDQILDLGMGPGKINSVVAVANNDPDGDQTIATIRVPDLSDSYTSIFIEEIGWLAAVGITKGCNPPTNDQFCPNSLVTRGQMAAFLVRALGLTDGGGSNLFTDDDGSVFENDIDRLATAGITKGCNPPTNDLFCPSRSVTRGEMAAFLVRALGLTDDGGGNLFVDDDTSIFQSDIDKLATAGITRGCNPPTNDRFCPDDFVTRGQMAAFLYRALN